MAVNSRFTNISSRTIQSASLHTFFSVAPQSESLTSYQNVIKKEKTNLKHFEKFRVKDQMKRNARSLSSKSKNNQM